MIIVIWHLNFTIFLLYKQAVLAHPKRYSNNRALLHVKETKCFELLCQFLQKESLQRSIHVYRAVAAVFDFSEPLT